MTTEGETDRPDPDEEIPPTPLSFKVMIVLAVIYLGWRLVQGLVWVVDRLT